MYFALKDTNSVISAVMFSFAGRSLKFVPGDGMKVIARGSITLYQKTGKYQIQVLEMMEHGVGDLALEYEKLKKRLEQKGYFDPSHKKKIPKMPHSVGVITSKTGAAVQDIYNILQRRFPGIRIVLKAASVQGDTAPKELTDALYEMSSENDVDVIIIGRGGGSIEDLWAFNSEMLADAIYDCRIPVISAVGHETDFTICDFVSDLRAPTPSAAAELAVPDKAELIKNIERQKSQLQTIIRNRITEKAQDLSMYADMIEVFSPSETISKRFERMDYYLDMLRVLSPEKKIGEKRKELSDYRQRADGIMESLISKKEQNIDSLRNMLISLNPLSILEKGYSYVEKDGKHVKSADEISKNDMISVKMYGGTVFAVTDKVETEGK